MQNPTPSEGVASSQPATPSSHQPLITPSNVISSLDSQIEAGVLEIMEGLKTRPSLLEEKVKDALQYADTLQQVEDLEFGECERLKMFSIINKQFPLEQQQEELNNNSSPSATAQSSMDTNPNN